MSSYGNLQPPSSGGCFSPLTAHTRRRRYVRPLLRDSRPEPASERRAMANEVATIAQQTSQRQSTRRQPGNAPGVHPGRPLFIR